MSYYELREILNPFELQDRLEETLIYGLYPEVFSSESYLEKEQCLRELSTAYLYKDVLEISSIKHSHKLHDVLRLLSFQVGSEVSMASLVERFR